VADQSGDAPMRGTQEFGACRRVWEAEVSDLWENGYCLACSSYAERVQREAASAGKRVEHKSTTFMSSNALILVKKYARSFI
jgi:hypothetical protein